MHANERRGRYERIYFVWYFAITFYDRSSAGWSHLGISSSYRQQAIVTVILRNALFFEWKD